MAIYRDGGFSAHCEAFLIVDGQELRLGKTNGAEVVLVEACMLPPNTEAELRVHVDEDVDTKRILLHVGATADSPIVPYTVVAPF